MKRALILAAVATILPACGTSNDGTPTTSSGMTAMDPGIETFADEGNTHVPVGTVITYNTDPPTSGNHYPDPQEGGFYTKVIDPGFLVHTMEHGGIIIYYDKAFVAAGDLDKLKKLAEDHKGDFSTICVVPRTDPTYPIILTAWTHRLRLSQYDQTRIDGFVTLYLGQGPEKD